MRQVADLHTPNIVCAGSPAQDAVTRAELTLWRLNDTFKYLADGRMMMMIDGSVTQRFFIGMPKRAADSHVRSAALIDWELARLAEKRSPGRCDDALCLPRIRPA